MLNRKVPVQSFSSLSYLPYKTRTKPGSSRQKQKKQSVFHSPLHTNLWEEDKLLLLFAEEGRKAFLSLPLSLLPAPLRTTTCLLTENVLQGLGSDYLHNVWLLENTMQELAFCGKADCKCYPQQVAQPKNFRMGCDSHACNDSPGNSAAFKHQHQIPDQD